MHGLFNDTMSVPSMHVLQLTAGFFNLHALSSQFIAGRHVFKCMHASFKSRKTIFLLRAGEPPDQSAGEISETDAAPGTVNKSDATNIDVEHETFAPDTADAAPNATENLPDESLANALPEESVSATQLEVSGKSVEQVDVSLC